MFKALQSSLPRHRVYISDVRAPWQRSKDDEEFHCPYCHVYMTRQELNIDIRHVHVSEPSEGWHQVDCINCGIWTWPKIENTPLCGHCLNDKK